MASNKVWYLKFVAGNPNLFSQVRTSEPLTQREALDRFSVIDDGWRKWIENANGKILKMNQAEQEWRAKSSG